MLTKVRFQGDIGVIASGGLGQHGDSYGVDAIFTQGPIAIHESTGLLAVVNVSVTHLEDPIVIANTLVSLAQALSRSSSSRTPLSHSPSATPSLHMAISPLRQVRAC